MNPYNTPERPEIRRFGDGDYRLAIEKMLKAARLIDNTELWAVSAHSVHGTPSYVAYDRFRTDVSWGDQMRAMTKFINSLAPMLRGLKLRVNLEAHGDETSFEMIRLIEEVGATWSASLSIRQSALQGDVPLRCDAPVLAPSSTSAAKGWDRLSITGWPPSTNPDGWRRHTRLGRCAGGARQISPEPHFLLRILSRGESSSLLNSEVPASLSGDDGRDIRQYERFADEFELKVKKNEVLGVEGIPQAPVPRRREARDYQKGARHGEIHHQSPEPWVVTIDVTPQKLKFGKFGAVPPANPLFHK